jgi:hypothetical protein
VALRAIPAELVPRLCTNWRLLVFMVFTLEDIVSANRGTVNRLLLLVLLPEKTWSENA